MSIVQELSTDSDSDILYVKGIKMTTKSFRACVFILDELLSCFDCHQFLIPVPATAFVYHKEITNPMDFRTLEFNLYNDKYKEFHEFIIDLNLIWDNAKQFHRTFDPIYQQADNLHKRFENIVTFLDGGERPFYLSSEMNSVDMVTDTLIPEEKIEKAITIPFPMYKEVEAKKKTNLYCVQAVQEKDPLIKKLRGYANVRFLFQTLNSAFFQYIETNSTNNSVLPLPRFYIAKNRTLLQQARVDPDGILAIMCNVHLTRLNNDLIQVRSTVIHCEPMDETHNFDENSLDLADKYECSPKAWLKLKIIRVVRDVTSIINSDMDKNYFKKVYNTFKLSTKSSVDIKKVGNQELAKEFAQSIIEPKSGHPGISTTAPTTPSAPSPQPQATKDKPTDLSDTNLAETTLSLHEKRPNTFRVNSVSSTPSLKSPLYASEKSVSRSVSPLPRSHTIGRSASNDTTQEKEPRNFITIRTSGSQKNVQKDEPRTPDAGESSAQQGNMQKGAALSLDQLSQQDKSTLPTPAEHDISETTSSKPLTVRLLVKPTSTPSENNQQRASSVQLSEPKKLAELSRVPLVVKAKDAEDDSDDETASYEYSDSEAEDNQDGKPCLRKQDKGNMGNDSESVVFKSSDAGTVSTPANAETETETGASRETSLDRSSFFTVKSESEDIALEDMTFPTGATEQWKKVLSYASEKNVPAIDISKYKEYRSTLPNAEGYFKHVFYAPHDRTKVIQTFKRMSLSQRTTEVVGLIALKNKPHIGQITEVLQEGEDGEVIGLCMQRYEKTLKHYTHAHSHHRLTAHQKMDLVIQMLESMKTIHDAGIAHRDLSEVNFMVNSTDEKLADGSQKAQLFLIDFGKSVFVNAVDYKRWWVQQKEGDRNSDTIPKTKEDLDYWCQKLPWVRSKPDHGYRLYRSIQTLPKNRLDTDNLPWLVHPIAEDLYSIGTLIWKTFSETEPWSGMLDTDLKGLREKIRDDYSIEKALQREVHGSLSRQLLLKFLKVEPLQRQSAADVLDWISDMNIQNGLIREWEQYAPVGRQKRHAKALFRYDEEQAQNNGSRKKIKTNLPLK